MFCSKCGSKALEGSVFCQKCGVKLTINESEQSTIAESNSSDKHKPIESTPQKEPADNARSTPAVPVSASTQHKAEKNENLTSLLGKNISLDSVIMQGSIIYDLKLLAFQKWQAFRKLHTFQKVLIVPIAIIIIYFILLTIYIILSAGNGILALILALVGYPAYQLFLAKHITKYEYEKESKILMVPAGMTHETIFAALNGRLNYPGFKGVRYGQTGECVIEGQYSDYSVQFDEKNLPTLNCKVNMDSKEARVIMLEAIAIRHYINKFFNPTLTYDAAVYYKKLKLSDKRRKSVALVVSVCATIVVIIFSVEYAAPGAITGIISQITTPGAEVRSAYLSQYSNTITIERAFENFFGNRKWSTYNAEGNEYVVFNGTCEIGGEKANVKITFRIFGEQFRTDNLEINGQLQNNFMLFSLLTAVYGDI